MSGLPNKPLTYLIRDATSQDVDRLAELHVQTFRETHGGGPSITLRRGQWEQVLGRGDPSDFTLIAEAPGGEFVGFARGKPHDGGVPGYQGELNKIYVRRQHHRHGLGRTLLCQIAVRLLDQGRTSMLLFGDARSPSNGFYEHLGGERIYSPEGAFHGAYGWRDLQTVLQRCGQALPEPAA